MLQVIRQLPKLCSELWSHKMSSSSISKFVFDKLPSGEEIQGFRLSGDNGVEVEVIAYGAAIAKVRVPDKAGKVEDVTLGFDDMKGFLKNDPYLAVTVGRVSNRIAKGKFELDGKEYSLAVNNGPNHLHGGLEGFNKKVFEAYQDGDSACFRYVSVDDEEGYPGELSLTVKYALQGGNTLSMEHSATSTKVTPISICNHSYFNLAGQVEDSVASHQVQLYCDHYLPVDDTLIPTGEVKKVEGTLFDFRESHPVGDHLSQIDGGGEPGYDHSYVLNGERGQLRPCARLSHPASGRQMYMESTLPAVQLYTGNFLDGSVVGKGGLTYKQHTGLCLETQHFPNAINEPSFPSNVLQPGKTYCEKTTFKFSW